MTGIKQLIFFLEIILLGIWFSCLGKKFGIDSSPQPIQLLIRCDDIGMCHSVNMAAQKLLDSGIPFSASVMVVCPWYQEAVEILKHYPQVSVGIHLTLNSEWQNYRWGPICGQSGVPSLTDSLGLFFPSSAQTLAHQPKTEEIERELRKQINRALSSGLKIDYVDTHMSTIDQKEEYRNLVKKLAQEYGLQYSGFHGETESSSVYAVPIDQKADTLQTIAAGLQPGKRWLLVCHIGQDSREMQAMIDMNSFGLKQMSRHRQAELDALLHPRFIQILSQRNIKLITYRDIMPDHHSSREESNP
ncbi:MAG: ChbG/HpnK family deacetylase [Candidatus Delongbacteria bacterium]|nr:ChbG/HpnK family deacetylase [Candidatus Delongbacteria bacterium]